MALTPEEQAQLNAAALDARAAALAADRTETEIKRIDGKISTALTDGRLKGDKGDAGPAGADGADGFSPTIIENAANDASTYKLDITDVNGTITTPNLKGADGTGGIGGGIEEAPEDGKLYGRKDATWEEVTGGGGGTVDAYTKAEADGLFATQVDLEAATYQSYLEWINDRYEFVTPPPDFSESGLIRYPVSFIEANPTDNPVVHVNGKDYPMLIADRSLLANRIAPQEQCWLWFRPNGCYVSGLDPLRASIDTGLAGVDQNEYMTPYVTRAIINQIVDIATTETYNSAKAYTDSIVKDYETISLFLGSGSTMGTNKPTGAGTVVETVLTTTEQLIHSASYTIPNDGVVLADNLYILSLFFNSISSSRITYIRAVYTVGSTVIFDSLNALNNTVSEFELYRQIINRLDVDTPYTTGTVATLDIYGRVDSGTDRMELVINDAARPSGLYRNAPIATLSAGKITTVAGGSAKSQEEFNADVLAAIAAGGGGGTGGTTNHSALTNLDYADSGHTGFASQLALDAVEAKIITDHNDLTGKDAANQHPISAITGLQTQLSGISVHNNLTGRNAADAHNVSSITGLETRFTQMQTQIDGITYVREGVFVGRWDFFRQDPLPSGWVALDGSLITEVSTKMPEIVAYLGTRFNETLSQSEWDAMHAAASGVGGVPYYVYDAGADTLRVPDVRGDSPYYGGAGWQSDAIRNITASITGSTNPIRTIGGTGVTGAFVAGVNGSPPSVTGTAVASITGFNASLAVPTDTTNHPRRVG